MRLAAFLIVLTASRAFAAPLTCTINDTPTPVKPAQVNNALAQAKQSLKKKGLHVLDLPAKARELRDRLDAPYDDPCMRYTDILALKAAVDAMSLDAQLLTDKATRIDRWRRGATLSEKELKQTLRWITDAQTDIARAKLPKANMQLNTAMFVVLKNKDLWHLPAKLPEPAQDEAAASLPTINDDEVKEACPGLAKRSMGTRDDYMGLRARLASTMNERSLRLSDIKDGPEVIAAARTLLEQGAVWPAVRMMCGAVARMTSAAVDVGLVSGRFQRIRERRSQMTFSKADELRFSELVRTASDHIAASRFAEAHVVLEQLLVIMGAPIKPATELE